MKIILNILKKKVSLSKLKAIILIKNQVMTLEELKEFLKEHLKIELYSHYESYRTYQGVRITIDGEEIDSSVNYDIEIY